MMRSTILGILFPLCWVASTWGNPDLRAIDPDAQTGPPFQGAGGRGARILRQEGNHTLHAATDCWVELAQRSDRRWAQLDAVFAHSQPRSAFACSQGMLGPSSAIATSNAATSSASSRAAISLS